MQLVVWHWLWSGRPSKTLQLTGWVNAVVDRAASLDSDLNLLTFTVLTQHVGW